MPIKNKYGYVFYENHSYLRKIGTNQFFVYTDALMNRGDMALYNPWATDKSIGLKKAPGVDDAEHRSNLTKEFIGLSRDEIREAVQDMNRPQRLLWAIDLLFQQLPIHDLSKFAPSRVEVMKIIGPPVSGSDLIHAVEKYKTNPTNVSALISEAAIVPPDDPEDVKEQEPDDLSATTHTGIE